MNYNTNINMKMDGGRWIFAGRTGECGGEGAGGETLLFRFRTELTVLAAFRIVLYVFVSEGKSGID